MTLIGATTTVDGESVSVRVGAPGTATTTIVDNDGAVMVSAEDPETVVEGDPVEVTVMLSGIVASDEVIVGYVTADGTGTDGATAGEAGDYTAVADGTLTIPKGDRSGTISVVTIADDKSDEAIEEEFTITLTLVSQLDNVVLADDATVTAKITDYPLLASVAGPASVREGMPATFTVTLDAGGDARGNRTNVTVTYTTAASTADAHRRTIRRQAEH